MTLAGQRFYIITSLKDISAVYKNASSLTFRGFAIDIWAALGMSKDGI